MLSNLNARISLLGRFARVSSSIKNGVTQKQYLFPPITMSFNESHKTFFSTSITHRKELATKEDNRRSLFLHRMQKKINHEDFEGALSVYKKLRALRLDDHIGVFNKLFNLSISQNDPAKIDQVLAEMEASNVQPISKTLEILFPYLIEKDMRDQVDKLVEKMKQFNIAIREEAIQESLTEYLKRPRKELPKKEIAAKKRDENENEIIKAKKGTSFNKDQKIKEEIAKFNKNNKEEKETKSSSDKKSKKADGGKNNQIKEISEYEKKTTRKDGKMKVVEKETKTVVDKEGKEKKIGKEKETKWDQAEKKSKKGEKEGTKKSHKKPIAEEDEEDFDEDEFDDEELIDGDVLVEKKKIKKIIKGGKTKTKKTIKKVKKSSK